MTEKNEKFERFNPPPTDPEIPRCEYPYADGRRCRMLRKSHASLCPFHAREEMQFEELDRIAAELRSLSGEFTTATDINNVLGKLFKLVAANRIPIRHAQLMTYLAQLMLYSRKAVEHEQTVALGFFGWQKIVTDIYRNAGIGRPSTTPPPEAIALMSPTPPPAPPEQKKTSRAPRRSKESRHPHPQNGSPSVPNSVPAPDPNASTSVPPSTTESPHPPPPSPTT
jgi:hypothetical protein